MTRTLITTIAILIVMVTISFNSFLDAIETVDTLNRVYSYEFTESLSLDYENSELTATLVNDSPNNHGLMVYVLDCDSIMNYETCLSNQYTVAIATIAAYMGLIASLVLLMTIYVIES